VDYKNVKEGVMDKRDMMQVKDHIWKKPLVDRPIMDAWAFLEEIKKQLEKYMNREAIEEAIRRM